MTISIDIKDATAVSSDEVTVLITVVYNFDKRDKNSVGFLVASLIRLVFPW